MDIRSFFGSHETRRMEKPEPRREVSRSPSMDMEEEDDPYSNLMRAYHYDGQWYISKFPREWAENHLPTTGPHECGNCRVSGTMGDIFIGYCANCADYVYRGDRGRGFMLDGKENTSERVLCYESAYDTYLSGYAPSVDGTHLVRTSPLADDMRMDEEEEEEDHLYIHAGYYFSGNQRYHEDFPVEWARNHVDGTGPEQCHACTDFGVLDGVFYGYCCNCAINVYHGEAGRGFIDYGREASLEELGAWFPSMFDIYLKGVELPDLDYNCP